VQSSNELECKPYWQQLLGMFGSKIFCVLEAVSEAAEVAFQYPHNQTFAFHHVTSSLNDQAWENGSNGSGCEQTSRWKLVLPIEPRLYKDLANGVILGSDRNFCDILLATDDSTGVYGSHFRLEWDWTSDNPAHLLIKNYSDNGTDLYTVYWENVLDEEDINPRSWSLIQIGPVTIGVSIDLDREPEEYEEFVANWRQLKSCHLNCRHH